MAREKSILLLSGDYADRLGAIYQAAQAAREDDAPLLGGEVHPYVTLREEYEALKAEAEAAGTRVRLRDPGRGRYRTVKAEHPPRTEADEATVQRDRLYGFNVESGADDLLALCVVEPEFKSRAAFDEWVDELGEGEFQTLLAAALDLSAGARFDPKSLPPFPIPNSGGN